MPFLPFLPFLSPPRRPAGRFYVIKTVNNPTAHPPLPPLSLYVHLPWCVRKCPYCDFNSHPLQGALPEQDYLQALLADWEDWQAASSQQQPLRPIHSVFFGGGTPSLFSPKTVARFLTALAPSLTADAEITLEANPGTLECGDLAEWRAIGINRLSLGIQSFDDRALTAIGRIHNSDDARRAAADAARHFANFNLDLMLGLPTQTLASARRDIEQALSFAPPHVSTYRLTIEANTRFAAEPPVLPSDDLCCDIEEQAAAQLRQQGFIPYEISAWAQAGQHCRHNVNYWQFGDYLGLGAGAHSKLTRITPNAADGTATKLQVFRQARTAHPQRYLAAQNSGERLAWQQEVPADELALEFLMNALRLENGFTTALFSQRTGRPLSDIRCALRQAADQGWIQQNEQKIAPTPTGRRYLNQLLALFMS